MEVVLDVGGCQVWKWCKKFGRLPCVEGSGKVLARAKNTELLEFVIGMVKCGVWAEIFLKLSE